MRARVVVRVVLGLALLGALVLALLRVGRLDAPAVRSTGESESSSATAAANAELMPATPPGTLDEPLRGASARETAAPEPTGPILGRLVEAEGGAPLEAVVILLLASPGDRVAETLRTEEDGSFTTERAFPRGVVRAWVRDPDTREVLVRHEAPFDPEAASEWRIPVPATTPAQSVAVAAEDLEEGESVLRGRVVSLDGRGVEGALVKALPLEGAGAPVCDVTETDGRFRLDELQAQPYRVLAQGSFAVSAPLELVLVEGENQAGELVLPVEASPGPIRGRLVAEAGGKEPFGVLLLRDLRCGKELAALSDFELFSGPDDGLVDFEILGVPPGEYELSVVTVDGRMYEPESLRVEPPREGLEFRARPARGPCYVFAVRDATTGATIEDATGLGRIHGQWWGFDPDDPDYSASFDLWIVFAPGHRAARGSFADAVPSGTDEEGRTLARIDVELAPGFTAPILFRDALGTRLMGPQLQDFFGDGLADVQVLAGGELVTVSGPEGLALVELECRPAEITFLRPGWHPAGERVDDGIRFVQMIRE